MVVAHVTIHNVQRPVRIGTACGVRLLGFREETGFDVSGVARWGSKCWTFKVEGSVSKGLCFFSPHLLSVRMCQAPNSVLIWDREAWCCESIWNILDPDFGKEMEMENGHKESSARTIVDVISLGSSQGDIRLISSPSP